MSCPTEGQHTTSQHIKKDGVPNDAVDWQEPDDLTIVITRCECGAFKKSGEPCKRCENLSSFFENSAGVDSITAQQLTDIAAKHESADDALVHIQKGLNGTGTKNVLAATKLALEQYYQTEITPPPQEQSANGHALTSNGHTSDNSAQTAYQEARGRFTSLMGDDALDTDDNLAPGYEGLQGTPLYEQFATTRDEYRAHMGMDNDPDVVEGEMRDGRYTLPKRVRTSLQASGLSGRDTTQLSRRFVEIGKESASRQQRRINARIESILTAEGITDPDAIARVTDVMNGRRRAKAASSSAVSKKKKSSRPKREVSEATRQKLREAAARRVRCPKCAAFMGKTECKRCTALREALEEIGIPASRLAVVQDQISGAAKKVEREYRQRNHTLMRQEAQEYLAEINRGDLAMPVLEALDKQLGEEPEKPLLAHLTPVDEWVRMGARPFEDKTLFPDWEKYGFSWDVDWETDDPEQATRWQHELETALAVALGHEITSGRKRKPIELDENEISVAQEIITALNAGETSPITVGRSPGGELNERANTLQELLSQAAADIRAGLAPTSVDKAAIAFNHRILRQTNPPQHVIEQATELRAEVGAKEIAETVDVTEAPEPGSGSAPTQHCPRCGRFVSPEQDCQHCGMTTADIADPARHEMGWYLAPDDLPVYTTQADAEAGGYRSSNEQEALALIEGSQLDIYQHPLRAIAAAEGLSYQVNYPALHANFASDDRRAMLDAADMVQAFHATQDTADPKLAEQPSQAWAFTHAFAGSRENLLAVIEDENAESPTALADKDALPHILLGYDKIQGTAVNCGDCGKLRSPDQPCLNCTGPGDANEEVLEASFLAAGWDESGSSSHAFHFGSRSAVAKRLADEPTSLMAPHLEKVLLEYDTRTGQAVKCENCGKFKSFDQACLHCDGMKAEALPESDEPAIETESAPEPGAAPSTEPEPTAHPVVTFTEGLGLSDDIVTLLTEAYDAGQIITFDELNDVLLATRVNGRPTDADFTQSWHDAVQKYGGTRQGIVDYINHPDTTDEEAATARQVLVGVDAGRNSAVKCADCGKFKSPDQPCVHCGGTETAELPPTPRTTTEIAHERGWTWIKFPALREMSRTERAEYRSIFDALREQHKVKWSKKRQAWFARSKVDPDEINRIVAEHEPAEKVPFTEETAPSPTPVDLPAPQPIAPGSVGRAGDWMQDADGGLHRIAYIHHNGEGTQVGVETGPSSGRITMSPDDVQAQFGVTIEPPTAVSKNGEMVRVGDVFQLDNETPYEVTAVTDDTDEGREGITIRAKNLSDPTGVHHTEWPGDQFEREPITIETRNQEIWRCGKCKSFVSPKDQTCKRCERFEQQMDALALGDVDVNVLRTQVVEAGAEHGAQSGEIDRTAIAASLVPILRPIGDPDTRQTVMREALFLLETEHGRQLRATLTDLGVAQGNINNYLDLPDNEREDVSRGNSIGIGDDVQAALRAYYQVETPEWHYVTNSADEGTPTIYRMAREYGYSIDGAMGAVQAYRDYFANDTLSPEQENEYGWMKADFETAIGAELDTAQKEAAPEPSQMPGEPEPTVAEAVTMRDEPQTTVAPTETAPAEEKQPAAEPPSTVLSDMIADGSAIMDAKGKARCGKCFAFVSPDDPTCKRCENMRSKIEGDLSNYPPEAVDNLIAFIEQLSQDPNINIADLPRKVHTDFETLCREAGVWHDINTQNKLTLAFTTYLRDSQEDRNEIKQQRQTPVSEPVDRPDAGEGDGTLAGDAPEYGSGIEENEPVADGRTDGDSANRRSDDRPDSGDRMHDAGSVDEPARGLAVSAGRGDNAGTGQPSSDVGNADTGRGGVGYRITDADNIGEGGPKTKYKNNVAAIRLLKQLEEEDRQATPEEQAILAKYVGWGGIPQAFDSWQVSPHNRNATWGNEYAELKELLTDAEWEAASASTPNAHYTSPTVINAMWQALEQMGYEGGNVLEPAAGVGHFYGLMPDEMRENSKRVAVELDDISARITRQLYPETDVRHSGYEKAGLPDDYFDMVVGNVPFGDYGVFDPDYTGPKEKLTRRIHNYFFAKTLDQTKPGGMVALITSRYTMDSPKHQYVREYLASQADMVGAVRLPNTAFKKNAGTEVTTDIIFLRKRAEGEPPGDTSWVETTTMNVPNSRGYNTDIPINEYFADNPDMMLGRMEATGTMYSDAQPQLADDGRDLGQALQTTVGKFPKDIASKTQQRCQCGAFLGVNGACNNPRCSTKQNVYRIAPTNMAGMMQHGELVIDGDVLCRYDKGNGQLETVQFKKTKSGKPPMGVQRATAALPLKEAGKRLLDLNLSHASDAELEAAQAELNEQYDEFVAKFGPLHSRGNLNSELKHDPQLPLLLSLENYDPDTGETTKADICHKRVINLTERPETADNAEDALMISLYEGGVNWARMHELTGIPVEELQTELTNAGYVFMLPDGRWELSEAYLSGDVKQKLKDAQAAAKLDPRFQANVDALLAVQPPTLKPSDIHIGFGAGWIPPEVIEEFTEHLLGGRIPVKYVPESATWYLDTNNFWGGYKDTTEWGVPGKNGNELLKDALNLKDTHITKQEPNGKGGTRRVTDHTATLDAREKQNKIKEEFQNWVWSDPDRSRRLADLYNNKFNRIVPREYRHPYRDDANFVFPGMNTSAFKLRNYQKDAVWRILQGDNTLLAHIVGAGKSATMITANMELKRLGVRNKPTHVMPKHTLKQYYEDFRRLYPGAKVLLVGNEDVSPKNRQRTMARIASEDWDAVLISQPSWERIAVSPQTEAAFLEQEVAKYAERIQALESEDNGYGYSRRKKNPSVKDLQKKKKRLEAKLEKAIAASQRDDGGLSFEQLGIDHVFADEVQAYKNLDFATKLTRMPGINAGKGSNRAMDMYMKTRYLQRRCKCGKFIGSNGVCPSCLHKTETIKGGVTFATATPLANSVVDMYTMQRYLQEDTLDEYGLGAADAWIAHYCETATSLEMKPSGDGWQPKTRIAKFKNVPESLRMFSEVADFQMNPDEMGLERPMLMGASDKDEYDLARQSFLAFAGQDALTDKDKLTPKFAHLKESQEWLEFEKARDEYRRPIIATAHFSPEQEDFFKECQRRADNLPADPREDNMLNILNDARKAALDYRMVDPDAPDDPNSKINMAVGNMLDIHQQHPGKTQMVFLDMGTPGRKKPSDVLRADLQKALQAQAQDLGGVDMDQLTHDAIDVLNTHTTGGQRRKKGGPIPPAVRSNLRAKLVTAGVPPTKAELAINDAQEALWRFKDAPRTFDLYNDMKDKMMAAGVPAEEIAFMHDAATDGKKLELYQKMNTGKLRFLFGSTDKMGTGVNAQKLMVAQHHIDPPRKMRPDEVEQRDGRILRHGNVNEEAMIYRYVTEPSPDAFAWGGIERKAGFIGQITRGDLNTREMEDIGGVELGFAELKAAASGDPTLIEFVQIEAELAKTESLERAYYNKTTSYKWKLAGMPQKEEKLEQAIATNTAALAAIKKPADNKFTMTVGGQQYEKVLESGEALQNIMEKEKAANRGENFSIPNAGELYGLPVTIEATYAPMIDDHKVWAVMQAGPKEMSVELSDKAQGNIMRMRNRLGGLNKGIARAQAELDEIREDKPKLEALVQKPFEHAATLADLRQRHSDLSLKVEAMSSGQAQQVLDDVGSEQDDSGIADALNAVDDVLAGAYA